MANSDFITLQAAKFAIFLFGEISERIEWNKRAPPLSIRVGIKGSHPS